MYRLNLCESKTTLKNISLSANKQQKVMSSRMTFMNFLNAQNNIRSIHIYVSFKNKHEHKGYILSSEY